VKTDKDGLYDAHVHLQAYPKAILGSVMRRSRSAGVVRFKCCGTSPDDWDEVLRISNTEEGVEPSIGLHPWFVDEVGDDNWFEKLEEKLEENSEAGIGEIGLDSTRGNLKGQKEAFLRQFELAIKLKRHVSIHCVKAFGALTNYLKSVADELPEVLIHAPSMSLETWRELEPLGVMITIGPRVLHTASLKVSQLAMEVDPDRVLYESDSPYTCVHKCSVAAVGGFNSPETLPLVMAEVARLRKVKDNIVAVPPQ
jgi:TatD DNase family protein